MLYKITKPLAKIALTTYFRKIYFSNAHRIPKDKPVILAANHPTAFIEPCILACWLDEPLHFMARGDFVLRSAFFRKLYDLYHIIPIYRIQDGGYQKLKDNFSAFDAGTEVLRQNKMILILAEGGTKHEKRLREIKKGVARVAFGSLEKHPELDIQIVPVAVNYSDSDKMRSVAMIDFGEAIPLKKYQEKFHENKNNAVRLLTKEIKDALTGRVIHIEDRQEDENMEKLLVYLEAKKIQKRVPIVEKEEKVLKEKKEIIDKLNVLDKEQKNLVFQKLNLLDSYCEKSGVSFLGAVSERGFSYYTIRIFIWLFPVFVFGYLGNFLPIWGAGFISKKYIKDITFRASTSIVLGIILYLIYWLTLMIIGGIIGNLWMILGMFLLPVLGPMAIAYKELYQTWTEGKKIKKLNEKDLLKLREAQEDLDSQLSKCLDRNNSHIL
jgi:glycerol-3-phosphate O-acyltransferase/dihydroxyacetone phosphate acyltransferase